jgi:hypothetical protein
MKTKGGFARKDAERLLPLLRSVGREIRERSLAIAELENRLDARLPDARSPQARRQIESELAIHRRELRRIERELAQLGCNLDADHPLRILIPGNGEQFAWEDRTDKTQFYRKPLDTSARGTGSAR